MEETGLRVIARKIAGVTNDKFADMDKHYVTIFVDCDREDEQQQPQVSTTGPYKGRHSADGACLGLGGRKV